MVLKEKTELKTIKAMEPHYFEEMVKIVIDKAKRKIAVNMEMHCDLGIELYDEGSDENDLFGANIYYEDGRIEWSSTLNIRQNRKIQNGTYGRIITDEKTIGELTEIVDEWIYR